MSFKLDRSDIVNVKRDKCVLVVMSSEINLSKFNEVEELRKYKQQLSIIDFRNNSIKHMDLPDSTFCSGPLRQVYAAFTGNDNNLLVMHENYQNIVDVYKTIIDENNDEIVLNWVGPPQTHQNKLHKRPLYDYDPLQKFCVYIHKNDLFMARHVTHRNCSKLWYKTRRFIS